MVGQSNHHQVIVDLTQCRELLLLDTKLSPSTTNIKCLYWILSIVDENKSFEIPVGNDFETAKIKFKEYSEKMKGF